MQSFPTLVLASLGIGNVVLAFAELSFLGIGTEIGYADWGQVLSFARNWMTSLHVYWYIIAYPGIALVLFVMGWNLLGDALRDVLDPGCAVRSKGFVQKKTLLKLIVLPLGIALLIAGLFFDAGIADSIPGCRQMLHLPLTAWQNLPCLLLLPRLIMAHRSTGFRACHVMAIGTGAD